MSFTWNSKIIHFLLGCIILSCRIFSNYPGLNLVASSVICPAGYFSVDNTPSTPTMVPSRLAPGVIPPSARMNSFACPEFTVVQSTHQDTHNYVVCSFIMCGGVEVRLSMCPTSRIQVHNTTISGHCTHDPVIRLFDESGVMVALNDDGCGGGSLCPQIIYASMRDSPCQQYRLWQGCYGEELCSGLTTITGSGIIPAPTRQPTRFPTYAPGQPTPFPTFLPTSPPSPHSNPPTPTPSLYRNRTSTAQPSLRPSVEPTLSPTRFVTPSPTPRSFFIPQGCHACPPGTVSSPG